jgi:hypothetical protein
MNHKKILFGWARSMNFISMRDLNVFFNLYCRDIKINYLGTE